MKDALIDIENAIEHYRKVYVSDSNECVYALIDLITCCSTLIAESNEQLEVLLKHKGITL